MLRRFETLEDLLEFIESNPGGESSKWLDEFLVRGKEIINQRSNEKAICL